MSAGTKVFLALFGLFILVVVFYYGLWTPGDPEGDLSLQTAQTADNEQQLAANRQTPANSRAALPPAGQGRSAEQANGREVDSTGGNVSPRNAGPNPGGDEIRMGGVLASDGLGVAANTAMDIDEQLSDSESQASGYQDNQTQPLAPPQKNVELVPVAQYVIEDGDTLSNVASRWFGDSLKWDMIVAVNPGLDPDRLQSGQTIKLPARDAQRPTSTGPRGQSAPRTQRATYVVRSDDSLSTIAYAHYGKASKWSVIYEANRSAIGADPNVLREGMTLTLPPA